MKSPNDEWSEVKKEIEINATGSATVKKLTLEKSKPEEKKYLGMPIKDLIGLIFQFVGLVTIALSILEFQNQIDQQRKQDEKLKSDEISQAKSAETARQQAERNRSREDSIYRIEQLRLQDESNKRSNQFNQQLVASLRIAYEERLANFQRDESSKKFKIYEPAVSELESLLGEELQFTVFSTKLKVFKEETFPKIYHVSDRKISSEMDSLIQRLDYLRKILLFKSLIDTSLSYSEPLTMAFLSDGTNFKYGSFGVSDVHIKSRLLPKGSILDSIRRAEHYYLEAFNVLSPPSKFQRLRSGFNLFYSVLELIKIYTIKDLEELKTFIKSPLFSYHEILYGSEYRDYPRLITYEISRAREEAVLWKNRVRNSLRTQGTLLPD